jgi:probable HAF family extracellular repeat protein
VAYRNCCNLLARPLLGAAVGLSCLVATLAAPAERQEANAPRRFTVTDLGTLGGEKSYARDLNNRGQVVGVSHTAAFRVRHAFLYHQDRLHDLGALPPYNESDAGGINEAGDVVGHHSTGGLLAQTRAFLYRKGKMEDLGAHFPNGISGADAINARGQIAGTWGTPLGRETRPFIFHGGKVTELGSLGGSTGHAADINDRGEVAGASATAADTYHAFLYTGGRLQDLGTLGGKNSNATALNNRGQVVGSARISPENETTHAFLYEAGRMKDLGTLAGYENSTARDINSSAEIVGYAWRSEPGKGLEQRAFLHVDGKMHDLNHLIPPDSGWLLEIAAAVNDHGVIAGHGVINGQTRAFVLRPVGRQ